MFKVCKPPQLQSVFAGTCRKRLWCFVGQAGFGGALVHGTSATAFGSDEMAERLQDWQCGGYRLASPISVGAGAHGVVYADAGGGHVVKVSRKSVENAKATAEIVKAECQALRRLEVAKVPHAERCVALCDLGDGDDRAVAVYEPYFKGARSLSAVFVASLDGETQLALAAAAAAFLVRCLAVGVAVVDLQALSDTHGNLLYIDFTEAGNIVGDSLGSQRASTMLADWSAMWPVELHNRLAECLVAELYLLQKQMCEIGSDGMNASIGCGGVLSAGAAEALAGAPLYGASDELLEQLAYVARFVAH